MYVIQRDIWSGNLPKKIATVVKSKADVNEKQQQTASFLQQNNFIWKQNYSKPLLKIWKEKSKSHLKVASQQQSASFLQQNNFIWKQNNSKPLLKIWKK